MLNVNEVFFKAVNVDFRLAYDLIVWKNFVMIQYVS